MRVQKEHIVEALGLIDLFLVSSGFEDRSKTLSLDLDILKVKDCFVFHLNDTYASSVKNRDMIVSTLKKTEIVEYFKNEAFNTYLIFYNKIREKVDKTRKRKLSIVVDVTAFAREALLILIKVLTNKEIADRLKVKFVHTPVESYTNDDGEWLTKGVRAIRPVVGFSGLMVPSKSLLLVVLNGFEDERTETIIETIEPVAIALGKPSRAGSINTGLKNIADLKYNNIKLKFNSLLVREFEFSCFEIQSTIDLINDLYLEYNDQYNIVVSPLNNKVSTIAAGIAAIANENIQICYATSNQYNINKKLIPSDYYLVYSLSDYYKIN